MLPDHAHHTPAYAWLSFAKSDTAEFIVSSHSLAEVYSVLTRLPRSPKIQPFEALQLLEANVTSCAELVALTGHDYISLVESLAQQHIVGGAVYDAIIAKAAEITRVDYLVTLNDSDFLRVWSTGTEGIVTPLSTKPPSTVP